MGYAGKAKDFWRFLDIKTKKELRNNITETAVRVTKFTEAVMCDTTALFFKQAELLKLAGKGCFLDLKNAACNWDGSCEICPKWQEALAKAKEEMEVNDGQ
jgi:hypothetical protein